jgi:D-alanyl-D-alanine carboxypeptidase/D-alanyl-D-alanine-endopeptidase (penicillin-binding protein 4)
MPNQIRKKVFSPLVTTAQLLLFAFIISGCSGSRVALYKKAPAFYSYIFGSTNSKHISVEHNADAYVTPASCQKVITALLAYKTLGPDYRFVTRLYVAKRDDKVHDLVISFSGDPTLTSSDLESLLRGLRGKAISGRIIIDRSLFKTPYYSNDVILGDIGTSYAGPVSAAIIDENAGYVEVIPTPGEALVTNDAWYKLHSSVITNDKPSSIKLAWDSDVLHVTGNINKDDKPMKLRRYSVELEPYLLSKMQYVLKKMNIRGKLVVIKDKKHLPKNMHALSTHSSSKLVDIITPAFKASNNLTFDALYLTMIHLKSHDIKSWGEGDRIIKDTIRDNLGIDVTGALIVDGSGISRYNRLKTRQLYAILQKGSDVPEFMTSFPSPGENNSTLWNANLPSDVRAKTGTLLGIKCLCGYRHSGAETFVMMANGHALPPLNMTQVVEEFVRRH